MIFHFNALPILILKLIVTIPCLPCGITIVPCLLKQALAHAHISQYDWMTLRDLNT